MLEQLSFTSMVIWLTSTGKIKELRNFGFSPNVSYSESVLFVHPHIDQCVDGNYMESIKCVHVIEDICRY